MNCRQIIPAIALTGALFAPGCARPVQETPTANLPADLREVAGAVPAGEGAILYEIDDLFSSVSVAVSDSGLYTVLNNGGLSLWRAEDSTTWVTLGGARTLTRLAAGGDGRAVYAASFDGVWRLAAGEGAWQSIGGPPEAEALAASADGQTVFVKAGDGIWRWEAGAADWQPLELEAGLEYEVQIDMLTVGPGTVYAVVANQIIDSHGDLAGWDVDVAYWHEDDGWDSFGWDVGHTSAQALLISGDGQDVGVVTSAGSLWTRGKQWPLKQAFMDFGVTSFLQDPRQPDVLYLGTRKGLYLSKNNGMDWTDVDGPQEEGGVNAILYHPRWRAPIVAADNGVFFVVLQQQPNPESALWKAARQFYDENREKAWFWPITALGSFISVYVLGMTALLVSAWRTGSTIFSRTWLTSIAAQPLLITPGLGKWALFLGYRQRLARLRAVVRAARDYFGLPAEAPTGSTILPEPTGDTLHECIAEALGPQQPVVIVGKGGAGKSTLLARWTFLALKRRLPASLKGFRPVLVPAAYYASDLVKAVADTLRERDGVAVNEEVVQAQLQSGKFLILVDGLTEVEADKQQSLQEILRSARHADYRDCRFILSSRPLEGIPTDVPTFHLRPLTSEVISILLPRYGLGRERESQVRRQLQSFGEKPVEPLLFAMALAQSGVEQVSTNRAQLYERYFRRLLRVEADETSWSGWRAALETIAQWFLLDTGRRGIGLPHEPLVDLIAGKVGGDQTEGNLVEVLQRYYHLPAKDELGLLQHLEAAGILQGGRRWRFAHDTFEEYFAASRLVSRLDEEEQWPALKMWVGISEREREFSEVLDFVREIADEPTMRRILALDLPPLWKSRLKHGTDAAA